MSIIGVIAHAEEAEQVREFFELFKTPWEWYRPDSQYDVVVTTREDVSAQDCSVNLLVVYGGEETCIDREFAIEVTPHRQQASLTYRGNPLPIYGHSITLDTKGRCFIENESAQQAVGTLFGTGRNAVARIGYNIFQELGVLLSEGQPTECAHLPTVERHIEILRNLIVEAGVTLVEIPPIPDGYKFIGCLTHDVDHPSIRLHRWDHTMFGFLQRAVFGSLWRVFTRRMPIRDLMRNWMAAVKLPLVHLGLSSDFWYEFDRYLDIEQGTASTFFVLPFKDHPGQTLEGPAPQRRASSYGAADIRKRLHQLVSAGCEIGLHGLDAWIDSVRGQEEHREICRFSGTSAVGVRMHWLCFTSRSPATIEQAGFDYDSTVGYNHTIGYRSGTLQVYRLPAAARLLELPLHIMDTAIFRTNYLGLTPREGQKRVGQMIKDALAFGGVLTINWHDRSISPERLWGEFYAWLVAELKTKGAWCTSAGRVVSWFQKRRSVVFQREQQGVGIRVLEGEENAGSPALTVRVFNPHGVREMAHAAYVDTVLMSTSGAHIQT